MDSRRSFVYFFKQRPLLFLVTTQMGAVNVSAACLRATHHIVFPYSSTIRQRSAQLKSSTTLLSFLVSGVRKFISEYAYTLY